MRRNAMLAPPRAGHDRRELAVSRGEAVVLAAVAVLLVPLLLLVGGALSLPSLLGRGTASLSPKLSERSAADRALTAPGRLSRLAQPLPHLQVTPPRASHRTSLRAARGARATAPHIATGGATRSTPNSDLGITHAPATGGTGSVSPAPPKKGSRVGRRRAA